MAARPASAAVPDAAVVVLRRLAELDADNPSALWLLGRAEAESGNIDAARGLWRRLLAVLPPDGDNHAAVKGAIESLGNPSSGG
jgi:cytochrome c-type biogenesis protein CcmH/NrfG